MLLLPVLISLLYACLLLAVQFCTARCFTLLWLLVLAEGQPWRRLLWSMARMQERELV